jgi:hypothetical protein
VEGGNFWGRIATSQPEADSLLKIGVDNRWTRSAKGLLQVFPSPERGGTNLVIQIVNQPKLNETNCLVITVGLVHLFLLSEGNVFRLRVHNQFRRVGLRSSNHVPEALQPQECLHLSSPNLVVQAVQFRHVISTCDYTTVSTCISFNNRGQTRASRGRGKHQGPVRVPARKMMGTTSKEAKDSEGCAQAAYYNHQESLQETPTSIHSAHQQ